MTEIELGRALAVYGRNNRAAAYLLARNGRTRPALFQRLRLALAVREGLPGGKDKQHPIPIGTDAVLHHPWKWDAQECAEFRAALESRIGRRDDFALSGATACLVLGAVRGLIANAGELTGDKAKALRNISYASANPRRPLTDKERRRLMRRGLKAGKSPRAVRDVAMVSVALAAGLRITELVQLRRADYDPDERTLLVRNGKGRREDLFQLGPNACRALNRWTRLLSDGATYLFPRIRGKSPDDKPLTRQGATKALRPLMVKAGLGGRTVHDLRATSIRRVAKEHGIHVAKVFARHADIRTTQRYIPPSEEELRAATVTADVPFYDWAEAE